MTQKLKCFFIISACLLLLSACGFHFQGKQELPAQFDNVYVLSGVTHAPITSEVILLLKTNNITVVDSVSKADVIFHILDDNQSSSQIGSNTTQETRIYRMTYSLNFSLESNKHNTLYGPNKITSSTTNYVYSGQVLGNNQEEEPIFATLRRDTLQKLLLKLSSKNVKTALEQNINENKKEKTDTALSTGQQDATNA